MIPDDFQKAWKADAAQTRVTIDFDLLTSEVQRGQRTFQSTIFWRDVREVGTSIVLIPIWIAIGIIMSLPWTWYLTIATLIWNVGFVLIDRRRHPQGPREPGEPLLYYVKESLTQVEHQIWLLRNVFWWHILPYCLSIMAFFLQVAWQTSDGMWEFAFVAGFLGLFLYVIYRSTYLINQRAAQTQLEPRRQDLVRLAVSLDDEPAGLDGRDIEELVSVLGNPISDWGGWAENWNRVIPSWRVASAIILPTLCGALCGLFSGLWLQIDGMGPTLFQTVVGAVLPFEIGLFWVWWRSSKRPPRSPSTVDSSDGVGQAAVSSRTEKPKPKRVPRSPAIVIIALLVFLSVMAVIVVLSFVAVPGSGSASRDLGRRTEPDFSDVSAFDERDVDRIDAWLIEQLELAKYPSLSVAIVSNGKLVYGKAFGFENIESGKQATLQTQYHVASVTKAFTASLAVMLHERGVVNLDHPVVTYLPKGISISRTPEVGATITLRQLASHTSGLQRRVPGQVQSIEGWYALEPQRLYQHLSQTRLVSPPGTVEEYSNLGFGLLGHALERAAGKPLHVLLQEMICTPLHLHQTAIPMDDQLHPATGYDDRDWRRERRHSVRKRLAGSGGLITSAEDLTKFLAAQMEPGVLSSEVLNTQQLRTELSSGTKIGTTLGWASKFSVFTGRYLAKNGGRSNCSAWIGFSREHRIGVVVLTNCGGPDVDVIGKWLLERSIPGAHKPVAKYGYAKVAPFTGVRWKNDRPIVQVHDEWSPLVSIDGISMDRILDFASKQYGDKARKRFAEDLVEVLSLMRHEPDWEVTLGLARDQDQVAYSRVRMTESNRALVRD